MNYLTIGTRFALFVYQVRNVGYHDSWPRLEVQIHRHRLPLRLLLQLFLFLLFHLFNENLSISLLIVFDLLLCLRVLRVNSSRQRSDGIAPTGCTSLLHLGGYCGVNILDLHEMKMILILPLIFPHVRIKLLHAAVNVIFWRSSTSIHLLLHRTTLLMSRSEALRLPILWLRLRLNRRRQIWWRKRWSHLGCEVHWRHLCLTHRHFLCHLVVLHRRLPAIVISNRRLLLLEMLAVMIVIHHYIILIIGCVLHHCSLVLLSHEIDFVNSNFRSLRPLLPSWHMLQILLHRASSSLPLVHVILAHWLLGIQTVLPLPRRCLISLRNLLLLLLRRIHIVVVADLIILDIVVSLR